MEGLESVGALRARQRGELWQSALCTLTVSPHFTLMFTVYCTVYLTPYPHLQVDPNETMLLVDYDEDDVDIKLAVLANPATADKGYDLTIRCGKSVDVRIRYRKGCVGESGCFRSLQPYLCSNAYSLQVLC